MIRETANTIAVSAWGSFLVHLELTKPRLTLAALATAALGYLMGADGSFNWALFLNTLWASALIGGGANTLNQYLERDVDAKMKRTQGRPLPSGRLSEKSALVFGILLSVLGTLHLLFWVNLLSAAFALTTLVGYTLVYTPLKRVTWLNTFVGAVMGALPILMGWAASGAPLRLESGILFLILFLWQLPHFLAIAWVYREDYLKGGLQMWAARDEKGHETARGIIVYSILVFLSTLLPHLAGMTGFLYFGGALLAGIVLMGFAVHLALRNMQHAKRFVMVSIVYLMVLLVSMMSDKL